MSKLVKKISRVLAAPTVQRRRPKRGGGKRRGGRKRLPRIPRAPRGILAGYGSALTASFYQARSRDGEIVRGMDLVTSPYAPVGDESNISYFITANPASWNGTRIAAIAAGYQNYRPLSFKIHYRPQVGSTSTTSMTIGTVWQNTYITSRSAIEPSLVTSPGGTYLPAWQSSCSVVPLGKRLPQRLFPVRDPHFTTVPFSVVCRASEGGTSAPSTIMPGRIFIEYAYEFRNAIGSGTGFQPSRVDTCGFQVAKLFVPSSASTLYDKAWILPKDDPATKGQFSGWIIDYNGMPSPIFPLFAQLSSDMVVAGVNTSTGDGATTTGAVALARINGALVPAEGDLPLGRIMSSYVYDDNGLPE